MNTTCIVIIALIATMVIGGGHMGLVRMILHMISFVLSLVVSLCLTLMLGSGLGLNPKGTVICFAVCFVAVYIALIIVSMTLKIINAIPLVSSVNRICGAILGAVFAVMIVWIFMSIVGALPASEFTTNVLSQIESNGFTKALYENNLVQTALDKFLWSNLKVDVNKLKDISKLKIKYNVK